MVTLQIQQKLTIWHVPIRDKDNWGVLTPHNLYVWEVWLDIARKRSEIRLCDETERGPIDPKIG